MKKEKQEISNYLTIHTDEIIAKWLDSIYSMKMPYTSPVYEPLYKKELTEDSKQTVQLIIDFFHEDKQYFDKSLKKMARAYVPKTR
ncbi:STAS domain protein [Listeria floridensis FSL S10-1187]|uniref:STAS domain protein n=1 Tax=Listeria floridensis FSL S10-1187 TaxID=1265817 RepID=A0ABP3AW38_9LIST|nr:hypothetical protein [Listeria floridensis]EUJ28839.1 STAS domain protein [Listeria floridensis FSL S10-1187]